ncbi:hypothetical protein GCM10007424_14630 [Flavobacterium suaedae]|uniref:T9SS type A sorting domain-containing protein n=1 Tax=Flavobacterium suaedae TaxID=1767027 RepID=A0ABQ1JUC6_9FLAO|nr:lamin tail domain-containing protein [Flavobacterium suaedae]GGB75754.1 hypothetical protein GCM10007424_14630 [Flavobacterium suaedae]
MVKNLQSSLQGILTLALIMLTAISYSQTAPVASAATDVVPNGFTANWAPVTGATGYYLDISESDTFGTGLVSDNLFISEYGEGSGGSKKYIEIYNGTGAPVDLSNYQLWRVSNGGTWTEDTHEFSSIIIPDGGTYVVANNASDNPVADDYDTGFMSHNGDDAVGLAWNGGNGNTFNLIDAIGTDGPDPGSAFAVAGVSDATKDHIIIRKSSVLNPTTDWAASAGTNATDSEWIVSSFTYNSTAQTTDLGSHTFDYGFTPSFVEGYDSFDVGNATFYTVTGLEEGTTYYYRVRAYTDTDVSDNSNTITVTTDVCGTVAQPTVSPLSLCGTPTVADLTVDSGENIQWYAAETGGEALATDVVVTTGVYYASQTVFSCESDRVAVPVILSPLPAAPAATSQSFCGDTTVEDLEVTGAAYSQIIFTDNFTDLSNWNVIDVAGDDFWEISSTGDPANAPYAGINGFQEVNEDWLVSNPIAISAEATDATISFINASNYDGPDLEVFYTNNYTGDVTTTSWETLSPTLSSGGWNWAASGDLDVSGAIGSNLVIAFKYTSATGIGNAKAWQIDDVEVTVNAPNLIWYDADENILAATDALSTGTYYVSQINDNGCESEKTTVEVTVNPIPDVPTVTTLSFCGATTVTELDATVEGTTLWYADDTTTTVLASDADITTGTYYVSQIAEGCESERTAVDVTVNPIPEAPTADAMAFCGSALVSDLEVTSGENLNWYDAETSGDALAMDAEVMTATYYVSQTSTEGCESARTAVEVAVNPIPGAPTVTETVQTFCGEATLADIATDGENVTWYDAPAAGNAMESDMALTAGTTIYYASQTVNDCESTERTAVAVVLNITAAPEVENLTFCGLTTVADLTVTSGTNLNWYNVTTEGEALASDAEVTTGTYYVSQTVNECESERAMVEVVVNDIPDAPTADAQLFCGLTTVSDLVVTSGENIQWYATENGGTVLSVNEIVSTGTYYASQMVNDCESERTAVSITVNPIPNAPGATPLEFCGTATAADLTATVEGAAIWYADETTDVTLPVDTELVTGSYYVSQIVDGCESERTMVAVTVYDIPEAPTADAMTFCGSAVVSDLMATGDNVQWYAAETGGDALAMDAEVTTGTYYVSQTVNICESERTAVAITVNAIPDAPTADVMAFCGSAVVSNLMATGDNVQWYAAETGGDALAMDAEVMTGTYYASQTVNGCESARTAVAITVNAIPDAPTADAMAFCGSAMVSDLMATGDNVQWYAAETGGDALATDAEVMTGTYYVSQTVNGCESARTSVDVTVTVVAMPVGEATHEFEVGSGETIADLDVTGNDIVWYSNAELTTMIETTTVLVDGTTYYAVATDGVCTSEALAVTAEEILANGGFKAVKFTYHPNPVDNVLNVECSNTIQSVAVYNLLGQSVLTTNADANTVKVDMSSLSAGTYIVRATSGNKVETFKVVKN